MKPTVENLENEILSMCKEGQEIIFPEPIWNENNPSENSDRIKGVTVIDGKPKFIVIEDREGTEDVLSLRCGWPKNMRKQVMEMLFTAW